MEAQTPSSAQPAQEGYIVISSDRKVVRGQVGKYIHSLTVSVLKKYG